MSRKDNHSRRVTFDTREELEDKIDTLAVMIGKFAARDRGSSRQLKSKFTKAKEEDRIEEIMIDAIMVSEIIKIDVGQTVETEGSIDKIEVDQDMEKHIEVKILEVTQEHIKTLKDRVVEESTGITIEMKVIAIGTGLEKDHSLEAPNNGRNNRSMSNSRSRS